MGEPDLRLLQDLYRLYPESVFRPQLLEEGIFFGVQVGDQLESAGGTHIVAQLAGIGALGHIFTRPDARGRGHGRAVVTAVSQELRARGCRDLIPLVAGGNHVAIRLYEGLGFHRYDTRWVGEIESLRSVFQNAARPAAG